ncbi:MAG: ATP-binding protein, partial [Burkholderiaceae bacterium]
MFSRLSLRCRIALAIFVLEAFMLAGVLGLTLVQNRQTASDFQATSEKANLDLFTALSVSALLTNEYSDYQLYLQEAEKQRSMDRIVLADRSGRIVADSLMSGIGRTMSEVAPASEAGWRARVVDTAAGPLGSIAVQFSSAALGSAYRETAERVALLALVGMSVIALIGLAAGFTLTRRLKVVTNAVQRFAAGDTAARSGVPGSDEVALLSRNFDVMVATVAEQRLQVERTAEELARLNRSLEDQVRVRTAELVEARQEAERASRAKTEFLATMSHEIRTPMNAILGLSYLALQGTLDTRQREYVEKAHSAAESLLGIINGVLDFSKVEAGKLQLDEELFALAPLLDRMISTSSVKARAKGLELRLEVDPQVPRRVVGDALRLGQVLLNLCDNAIKFTDHGHILVRVERLSANDTEVELMFEVTDTGYGIPDDRQQAIFEDFTQGDASITRRHGGSGLGLAIVRKLVELMGGAVGVRSQPGSGCTFHFSARFGAAPAGDAGVDSVAAAAAPLDAVSAARLRGAKVLVAEDNEV